MGINIRTLVAGVRESAADLQRAENRFAARCIRAEEPVREIVAYYLRTFLPMEKKLVELGRSVPEVESHGILYLSGPQASDGKYVEGSLLGNELYPR